MRQLAEHTRYQFEDGQSCDTCGCVTYLILGENVTYSGGHIAEQGTYDRQCVNCMRVYTEEV